MNIPVADDFYLLSFVIAQEESYCVMSSRTSSTRNKRSRQETDDPMALPVFEYACEILSNHILLISGCGSLC